MLPLLLTIAVVAAVAFANGANDVSKGVAPLVGSGVAGYRTAIAWGSGWTAVGAALGTVFAGAMLATFGTGLLAPGVTPSFGAATAALAGTAAWVAIATTTGLPVSTTHALVGAVIGATTASHGPGAIRWGALGGKVVLPLLLSPLAAYLVAGALARALRVGRARGQAASDCLCADLSPAVALAARPRQATVLARHRGIEITVGPAEACPAAGVRLTLGRLQWASSAATSLARGMNDAPKMVALGLAAAALASSPGARAPTLYLAVTAGMVAGGLVAGRRVTHLLAERVTELDASSGLAASGVTAVLVAAGAFYGLPMSTTHVASGGLAGVGAVRESVNWATLRQMGLAWIVTLPASAAIAGAAQVIAGMVR